MMASSAAPARQGRELPAKEAAVFKSVLKFYEHKQYKKGLKASDSILKKFPSHGETLAMKGLFCSNLDRKEEAIELIKKGLMNDLTSHICWHVYGLYHRSEQNYEEAIKCYTHALKYDKENNQIMRDYSVLQIQIRNFEAFNDMRHQLLTCRPTQRNNWLALSVSYDLLGKPDAAEKVITAYEESVTEESTGALLAYENSEILLYKNQLIQQTGDYTRALEHLESVRTKIVNPSAWRSTKAHLLLKAGKHAEAEVEYMRLLKENEDSLDTINGIREARGIAGDQLDSSQIERLLRLFKELKDRHPRSHAIQRLPLDVAVGGDIRPFADAYLPPMLRKGTPALVVSLRTVLSVPEKRAVIEELVLEYYVSLKTHQTFKPPSSTETDGSDAGVTKEPPTSLLWTLYFLAQLYDHQRDTTRALEFIDEAIAHSPTVVELHMIKARIYKHAGDLGSAMRVMNEARLLDLQDRFVNTKCAKYMLANNHVKEAEETMSLFTKSEAADPVRDLIDMQCLWYANAAGQAHFRLGNHGRSLKYLHQIEKHFVEFYDDQCEFHTYAFRRATLRAYVDMLRAEDRLRSHPFFTEAAKTAVRVYLELYHGIEPSLVTKDGVDLSTLSESERKKVLRKARKAELKSQSELTSVGGSGGAGSGNSAGGNTAASGSSSGSGGTGGSSSTSGAGNKKKPVHIDQDPLGKKFTDGVDVLDIATTKFLKPLHQFLPNDIESWVLGCNVYLCKRKYLLALRCVNKARALSPDHPDVHQCVVQLAMAVVGEQRGDVESVAMTGSKSNCVSRMTGPVDPVVMDVLIKGVSDLMSDTSTATSDNITIDTIIAYTDAYLSHHAQSAPHRLTVAESRFLIHPEHRADVLSIVSGDVMVSCCGLTLSVASQTYWFIQRVVKDSDAAVGFRCAMQAKFPFATLFR